MTLQTGCGQIISPQHSRDWNSLMCDSIRSVYDDSTLNHPGAGLCGVGYSRRPPSIVSHCSLSIGIFLDNGQFSPSLITANVCHKLQAFFAQRPSAVFDALGWPSWTRGGRRTLDIQTDLRMTQLMQLLLVTVRLGGCCCVQNLFDPSRYLNNVLIVMLGPMFKLYLHVAVS